MVISLYYNKNVANNRQISDFGGQNIEEIYRNMPFVTGPYSSVSFANNFRHLSTYDAAGITENARRVNAAFAWNKGYREYFAVKATPTPAIIEAPAGGGLRHGLLQPHRAHALREARYDRRGDNVLVERRRPTEEFVLAHRLGAIINFDDISHIPFYDECVGEYPETMCCRYNPGGKFSIANRIMDNPGEAKYGMTREQISEAFRMLMQRGVKHLGIHAFLASNTTSEAYYPEAREPALPPGRGAAPRDGRARRIYKPLRRRRHTLSPRRADAGHQAIGEGVKRAYEDILVPEGMGDVQIFTEMGRFMLAPYGCLVTKVLHEKKIYKDYIGVDASACDLMRPAMYGAYHHITVAGRENAECDHLYDVTGSLCENNDKFAVDRMLPEIHIGDTLVIHDTGAHGRAMGYNYNGRLRSAEVLLRADGSAELIRRAETPEDYFATLNF